MRQNKANLCFSFPIKSQCHHYYITLILASFNYFICPAKYQTFILLFYLLLVGRDFLEFLKQLYTQDFILFKDSS